MRIFFLLIILILLTILEILRVYFIMPFPGSQKFDVVELAYWLDKNIYWIRLPLIALLILPVWQTMRKTILWQKTLTVLLIIGYLVIFYLFNFRYLADKIFYQPTTISFADAQTNKIDSSRLVIGVELNGEAKAYPIQLIGYHHQVRDSVGGTPVMVTYCTVCRTGRVFSPFVDGNLETFRLVGMDHFNAMFEDKSTHSWWRQVSGEAITGPLKGKKLDELPSRQMSLASWLRLYPTSAILQPDSLFKSEYADLDKYDDGTVKSSLEKRDSLSWKPKSWVIGVVYGKHAKAYDWNALVDKRIIQDSLPGLSLMVVLENDSASFHTWNRDLNGQVMKFRLDHVNRMLIDSNSGSTWNMNGECTDGKMKGARLKPVRSSQEFWHSWKQFHPHTVR